VNAALRCDRRVCIMGRSMVRNSEVARQLGYLKLPADQLVQPDHIRGMRGSELLIITTGSQGEPTSSLSRMALGDHKHVDIIKGDLVIISARKIPGNEKAATKIINHLFKRGAEVLYEDVADVHVSGHGQREEQKKLLELVRPRYFVPVHGEYRHLVLHKRLAEETGVKSGDIHILENGDCLTIDKSGAEVEHGLPQGVLFVDGGSVQDVGEMVLRDRKHLAEDGVVVVLVSVDAREGKIIGGPDLVTRGVSENLPHEWMDEAKDLIRGMLEADTDDARRDWATVNESVRKALQKFFARKTSRRPMVLPVIMEI
jgi:ribonuclease J